MKSSLNYLIPMSEPHDCRTDSVRNGSFKRGYDGKRVQRFLCKICKSSFSESTFKETCWQKKPFINATVFHLLCGGFSQRRAAFVLGVDRKTIVRKFILLGIKAEKLIPILNRAFLKVESFEFDDLETFEHTKCKPISVTMAVESKTRWVIGSRVSNMSAKGKLSKLALKKYGKRKDTRKKARQSLFNEIKEFIEPDAHIQSDMNPHYMADVKEHFPNAKYQTHRSRRACVVGQGELKRGGFDPLFTLNHTFAMFRANMNRLFRRTWCTTKKPERLGYHIALYTLYHNLFLINLGKKQGHASFLTPELLSGNII